MLNPNPNPNFNFNFNPETTHRLEQLVATFFFIPLINGTTLSKFSSIKIAQILLLELEYFEDDYSVLVLKIKVFGIIE